MELSRSVAYAVRDETLPIHIIVNLMLNLYNGTLFVSKTVRELLFDGYEDPLLNFLIETESPYLSIPMTKFGWFVDRNMSSEYSGTTNIYTGADDISKLGKIHTWNYENRTQFYRDECGMINGTTGELWPPGHSREEPISMFIGDLCRSFTLNYESDYELYGIPGSKYIADESLFDNGNKYPNNLCFCNADKEFCPDLMSGVLNVSVCRFGAPAFVSLPHFYLADESFLKDIDGLQPNKDEHEFFLALEPSLGIPIEVNARLQINIRLQDMPRLDTYNGVPNIMVPMLWFRQLAQITEDLASDAKLAVVLLPALGLYVAYGLSGIGAILIVAGSIFAFIRYRKKL